MSTTRLQELQICFGKQKQADIATANTAVQMWQLRKHIADDNSDGPFTQFSKRLDRVLFKPPSA